MRVVIAAGGSGGHLYPAQRCASALQTAGVEVLFVGGGLVSSPFFDRDRFPFCEVPSSPLRGRSPLSLCSLFKKLSLGVVSSWRELRRFRPHLIVGFGSYHSWPVLMAARLLSLPLCLYEANVVPGRVVRWFSSSAKAIAIQFPSCLTQSSLRGKGELIQMSGKVSGFCRRECEERSRALAYFGLQGQNPVLLIAGGSQGASAINLLAMNGLTSMKGRRNSPCWDIIHLTGSEVDVEEVAQRYRSVGIDAVVKPFEGRMEYALRAADLFFGRSGASTIAELTLSALPSLLIPYPHAAEEHQWHNARYFCDSLGGGVLLRQEEADEGLVMESLLRLEKERRQRSLSLRMAQRGLMAFRGISALPTLEEWVCSQTVGT